MKEHYSTMSSSTARIRFFVGGAVGHPAAEQARQVATWLGDGYTYDFREGRSAFESLDSCDLLVLMGHYFTAMPNQRWAGNLPHEPLLDHHKQALEAYVASGRPLLAHHGTVGSYDDWPRYGELVGVSWVWGVSGHPPFGDVAVRVLPTGHQVVAGLNDYTVQDELYYKLAITAGAGAVAHAEATWEGQPQPMVLTHEGGRVPGAGRLVYLANGHDMRAFASPALRQLWTNAVRWLLERE
jgi:type 1 glutamine amidotransferase